MTAIAAAAAPTTPAPSLLARAAAAPAASTVRADQPAVISDVASQAASGAGAVSGDDLPITLRGKISRVLEDVGSLNASVSAEKFVAWDVIEAKFGKAKMEENKQAHARTREIRGLLATQGVAELQGQAGVSGLSLTRKEDGGFAVGEFSFTDAGSTYTVKQWTDGRMVGLKDGQGWKTWQVEPPASSMGGHTGTAVALATLTAQPTSDTGTVPTNLLA